MAGGWERFEGDTRRRVEGKSQAVSAPSACGSLAEGEWAVCYVSSACGILGRRPSTRQCHRPHRAFAWVCSLTLRMAFLPLQAKEAIEAAGFPKGGTVSVLGGATIAGFIASAFRWDPDALQRLGFPDGT